MSTNLSILVLIPSNFLFCFVLQVYIIMSTITLPPVSKLMSVVLALPHIVAVLKSGESPSLVYFVTVAISIYILYMYMRRVEFGGSTSNMHSLAAALLPIVSGGVILTYLGLLWASNEKTESEEGQELGSSLGAVVHQYRLDEVLNRFRDIVSTRQEELNVSEL